jgi:ankyrin repeat protein
MDPNAKDATGYTPLMYAAKDNNRWTAAILLSRGANPREMSPDGVTPLLLSPISPAFVRTFRKMRPAKQKIALSALNLKVRMITA